MRRSLRIAIAIALSLIALGGASAEECNTERMRRCRSDGLRDADAQDSCTSLRENFDCLVWQTSMCLDQQEQEGNRDAVLKLWRHLSSFCENTWYTKACFQRSEVKRCEALLPPRGHSTGHSSCRSYASFRECVTSAVASCASSERRLLGTYLVEKGQQRAFMCPPRDSPGAYPDSAAASLAAEPGYGDLSSSCGSEWREAMRECGRNFETSEREARDHNDSDMRHHATCCALVQYESCVEAGTWERDRERCRTRDLVSERRARYAYYDCADHTPAECSACPALLPSLAAACLALALLLLRRMH